jgi:hypothetical protein
MRSSKLSYIRRRSKYEPDNFGNNYSLSLEQGREDSEVWERRILEERQVKLAEKRLRAAQSEFQGETVERAAWIRLAQQDVESAQSAQMRLDKIPKPEDRAADVPAGWPDGEGMKEWWEVEEKRREASKQRYEVESKAYREVKFAKEGLKAAESDDFGETIERAALIRLIQEELESARARLDESRKSEEKVKLRGAVLSALNGLANAKRKLAQHKILLEWIDRQLPLIATPTQDTENHGHPGQVKKARSKTLRNQSASKVYRPNGSSKALGHKGKRPTARSILSPFDPSRVSKAAGKKSVPRQKQSIPCDVPQSAEKATIHPSIPLSGSQWISKAKENMPTYAHGRESTSLRPMHSSRVSKRKASGSMQSAKLSPTTDRCRNRLDRKLDTPSAGLKPLQHSLSVNIPPRRSTRISKKRDN